MSEEGVLLSGEDLGWEQGPQWALPRLSPTLMCSPSPLQDHDSTEEGTAKPLMSLEVSPVLKEEVAEETGEKLEPGVAEQLEELGTEEQEEDQEPYEEPNNLGDPAVMKAVQSKPTLEVMCERRGRGPTPGQQAEGLVGSCCFPFHPHTCQPCPTEAPGGSLVPA